MNTSTFITDGHWRKSLAAVRALGSKGIGVTVGESTRLNTASFSRHCNRAIVYPSPFFMQAKFVDFMLSELARNSYEMLLVMEDQTLELLTPYHSDISKFTYFPSVGHEKLRFAQRKDKILKLAAENGIPIPKTWYIEDLSRLDEIKGTLPYPVVIKPKTGAGAVGIAYPQNSDDFLERYMAVHKEFPFPVVQEKIPREGAGYGASFLLDEQGHVKASFVHKRMREYPITGGASTLRESARHDDIRDMALTLLKALDWFGVAMVEFKLDPRDNTPKLMEINPRFWGSLALAIESGVNFPYLLHRMARGENIKPVEHYQIGKRCRWLLPGDFLNFIHNSERMRLVPGFFDFWDKNTAYDILSVRDPMPAIGRLLTPLTFLYDQDMKHRLKIRRTSSIVH